MVSYLQICNVTSIASHYSHVASGFAQIIACPDEMW